MDFKGNQLRWWLKVALNAFKYLFSSDKILYKVLTYPEIGDANFKGALWPLNNSHS